MNEAISVPAKGRKIVIIKVETRLSPMILETIMNFLSIYPIVLWISKKRHRQRIDDIADQQSVKSIDIKQLSAK